MNWHTVALPVIVISVIVYHLSQKSIPAGANPLVAIATAYLIAFTFSVLALLITERMRVGPELVQNQNWIPVICLGLTAIGIELGYLYAYRTGWKISTTGITAGAFTTGALALIGVLWFKEGMTLLHAAGIILCMAGIVCINFK